MQTRGTPSLLLASVPNMLGDSSMVFQNVTFFNYYDDTSNEFPLPINGNTTNSNTQVDLPLASGGLRTKISENNKALPVDRVYFQYNHFHNAANVDFDTLTSGNEFSSHLDRYTIGLEKTFRDKLWSIELRMPFASRTEFSSPDTHVFSGETGNLNAIVKRLLVANQREALAIGVGINMPTGSDVRIERTLQSYLLKNEAVHLSPFLGSLFQPNDRFFYQGFLELDVPLNGNPIMLDEGFGPMQAGILTEQPLLQIDLSAGYWIYRNPDAYVTDLASIVELHYTGTLRDADVITIGDGNRFGHLRDRFDLVHMTVGLHATYRQTTFHVGGVFPLSDPPNRTFDAEFQIAMNRYF